MRTVIKWSLPALWAIVYFAGISALPAQANNVPPTPFNSFYGDATGDTIIDASDIAQMRAWVLGLPYNYDTLQPQTAAQAYNTSDVTSDNLIDASDLSAIRSWTLGFSVPIDDKPWALSNENLPTSIAANTPTAFQINLASTLGTQFGRAGLPVIANIDAANSSATGSLGGRTCTPVGGSRDQLTLPGDQCAISVTVTDWFGVPGPTKGLTETGTYGFSVTGTTPGNLRIVFSISGNPPELDIPAVSIGINVTIQVSDQIAISCPASVNETDSISCAVVTATGPGLCSIAPSDTCGGSIDTACVGPYTAPVPGETKGPGSCVAAVQKGVASDLHNINITEVNQNPSITLNCPAHIPENAYSTCSMTVSDPDLPAQNLTCTKNAATTCTGYFNGCASITVYDQGENNGPGSCVIAVDVRDNFTPPGTAQASATLIIDEVNRPPIWSTSPTNITIPTNWPYDEVNGKGADTDYPRTLPTDPGYFILEKASQTCSFPITVVSQVNGLLKLAHVSFPAVSSPETCSFDLRLQDGYGATLVTTVLVNIRAPSIIYVKSDATGANDGTSWANAFTSISPALTAAQIADEIWVARGSYSGGITLKSYVSLYGGFRGTESSRLQRGDPFMHTTSIGGYCTVVNGASHSRIDGFTIGGGGCDYGGGYGNSGGGMYNYSIHDITVASCLFTDNFAISGGGAIYNANVTNMLIEKCIFQGNTARYGVFYDCCIPFWPCNPSSCLYGNPAGGAIYNTSSSLSIVNSIFTQNSASSVGGAIANSSTTTSLMNCTFYQNSSGSYGGAIYNDSNSPLTITNSIFWGDNATTGAEIYSNSSSTSVTYSDVMGGITGTGNINSNPYFSAPPDVFILSFSPCRDTGTMIGAPATDIQGVSRPEGSGIDMGAYEYDEKLWYVDIDATGAGTGASWIDAFTSVQDAMDAVTGGDTIWIAEGTYANAPGDKSPVLKMKNDILMYGGFTGTETALWQRNNLGSHPTILDGQNMSNHVVEGGSATHLDGFIITGGHATGTSDDNSEIGGGMLVNKKLYMEVNNCVFINNVAKIGAGMSLLESQLIFLTNCIFNGNTVIENPNYYERGGGIYQYKGDATITNCTFSDNNANGQYADGGAIFNYSGTETITNSILWGNTANGVSDQISGSPITITYSDIEGGKTGTGNINADPLFEPYPDLHLQSGSPCIDKGTATGAPAFDLNGDPRPYPVGGAFDMGAYEFQITASINCASPGPNPVNELSPMQCSISSNYGPPIIDTATDTCGGSITGTDPWTYNFTPSEAQGPGICLAIVKFGTGVIRGASVNVLEVNVPPVNNAPAAVIGRIDYLTTINISPTDTDIPVQALTCSIESASGECVNGVLNGCTWSWTPTAAQAPTECDVVTNVYDGVVYSANVTTHVTINGLDNSPTVIVDCPDRVNEDQSTTCSLTATDPDIPAQVLTCSKNPSTTCVGAVVNGCTSVNVPAQGEAAGPGSCSVVIDVADDFIPPAYGQGGDIINILEVNDPPLWSTAPSDLDLNINQLYDHSNGRALDEDMPNSSPGDYGFITCSAANNTCSFPISISGSGAGASDCRINFTSGSGIETCAVDVVVTDGQGLSISKTISIKVNPFLGMGIWLVDADATGANNGTSWTDAFTTIQDAVNQAMAGEMVWVAEGTYTRPLGSPTTQSVLVMKMGVNIYGGFTGTELVLSDRGDPASHPTVLDGQNTSYHVVVGASNSIMDGFIIMRGTAIGTNNINGAGMYNSSVTNVTVSKCIFTANSANGQGGGVYNGSSSVTITDSTFTGNSTLDAGGGIYYNSSTGAVTRCAMTGNSITGTGGYSTGGGIMLNASPVTIDRCIISQNTATYGGGGVSAVRETSASHSTIVNSLISNNNSGMAGGLFVWKSYPTLFNCTIASNAATGNLGGGGIRNDGPGYTTVTNSIIWGNTALLGPGIFNMSGTTTVTYSDVQSGWTGTGNLNADPLFSGYPDLHLVFGSPCIDSGTASGAPMNDLDGYPRPYPAAGLFDMGAYEWHP